MSDKYEGTNENIASKRMLKSANVKWRQMKEIKIELIGE